MPEQKPKDIARFRKRKKRPLVSDKIKKQSSNGALSDLQASALSIGEEIFGAIGSVFSGKMPLDDDSKSTIDKAITLYDSGKVQQAIPLLKPWHLPGQHAVIPFLLYAKHYLHKSELSYDDFVIDIQKALKMDPDSPVILQMAYVGALRKGDDARRLFFACKIAERKRSADWHFVYGVELKSNLMNKKAEAIFKRGLGKDASHVNCMMGLSACYLERLEIDKAENILRNISLPILPDFAKQSLKTIQRLKDNKAWTDLEKQQKEFWNGWAKRQLQEITTKEQKKLLAECFVRK